MPLSLSTLRQRRGEAEGEEDDEQGRHEGGPDGHDAAGPVGTLDREHRRDDGARSGQERRAERDEGDVDPGVGVLLGLGAGEQLERDDEQQQAAGALERRQRDVQVVEDPLTEDGERGDDPERDERRPSGRGRLLRGRAAVR